MVHNFCRPTARVLSGLVIPFLVFVSVLSPNPTLPLDAFSAEKRTRSYSCFAVFDFVRYALSPCAICARYGYILSPSVIGARYGYISALQFEERKRLHKMLLEKLESYEVRNIGLVRRENIPALSASDWSVVRIYPHVLRPIGPS
eukprot:1185045-Prorocentrum_minimum.AAC.2